MIPLTVTLTPVRTPQVCEDVSVIAAMTQPGGGRNDIPARLRRHFFTITMTPPTLDTLEGIFGQLSIAVLKPRLSVAGMTVVGRLMHAMHDFWTAVKGRLLPTPSKFHYVFSMVDINRVFRTLLVAEPATLINGGSQTPMPVEAVNILRLWRHECLRVFQDKLVNPEDKGTVLGVLDAVVVGHFGEELHKAVQPETYFGDFFRDDVYDADGVRWVGATQSSVLCRLVVGTVPDRMMKRCLTIVVEGLGNRDRFQVSSFGCV